MRSQCLCNITYTAAPLTHSLYGLPVLVMQALILSFCHVLCSFPFSFAFYSKKISVPEFLRSARSSFLLFPIKKENRQRLYNLLSIFILKLIEKAISYNRKKAHPFGYALNSTCARRFELPTFWSVARRSIQLSYAHITVFRFSCVPHSKIYYSVGPHGCQQVFSTFSNFFQTFSLKISHSFFFPLHLPPL